MSTPTAEKPLPDPAADRPDTTPPPVGRNLMDIPVIARILRSPWYPGVLRLPVAAVFGLVAYQLLMGPDAAHDNAGTALMWVLWWPLIPIVFVLLGRFWCAVCPFGWLSDQVQRLVGANQPVPAFMKKYGIWIIDASFEAMTKAQIVRFYRRHYRAPNMVVSVAGNLDHAAVVRRVRRSFGRRDFLSGVETPAPPRSSRRPATVWPGTVTASRPFEQVNLVLGMEALARDDERRFALGVLNTALGGGTSSRLFQEVRERRGLAYSVFSFTSHYADSGVVGVSVGCLPSKLDEVLATVRLELTKLAAEGITEEELVRGKGQLRGGLVLGLEDSGSRMSRIGKAELVHDELLGIDEVLARIEAVTLQDVRDVAAAVFSAPEILAVVGPT